MSPSDFRAAVEFDDDVSLHEDKKLLLKILLIYCVGLTLCRLTGSYMRYVSWVDWGVYRNALIVRLPYYLMPFIALFWLKRRDFSRVGLFFTGGMGLVGILDHGSAAFISIVWGLPFFRVTGREPPVRLNVLAATLLAIVFTVAAFRIYKLSRRLYSKTEWQETSTRTTLAVIFLICLYCVPFVDYTSLQKKALAVVNFIPRIKDYYSVGSTIEHLTVSPDGKLLAIAAYEGFYVWDIASKDFVLSDDRMPARRARFSASGKYLAAVGGGDAEGRNCITVYELPDFRRLEQVKMPPLEDPLMRRIFRDVVFRPDERTVLSVWNSDWKWSLMSSDERNRERALEGIVKALYFVEHDLETGFEVQNRTVEELHLMAISGTGFLPLTSELLLFNEDPTGDSREITRMVIWDTTTWEKRVIFESNAEFRFRNTAALAPSSLGGFGGHYRRPWILNKDGRYIYMMPQWAGYAGIAEIGIDGKSFKYLYRQREKMSQAWLDMAPLPDGRSLALLGRDESSFKYGRGTETVRIVDLESGESYLTAEKIDVEKRIGRYVVGVNSRTVAIATGHEKGYFFFMNIEEEEK